MYLAALIKTETQVRIERERVGADNLYLLKELLSTNSGPGVHRELHLRNFLINFLHKVDNKVHQLVSQHLLGVEVGDEEANVVSLDLLPPEDDKVLRPPHHESHELVAQ